jgi:hypothetical protein
LRYYGANATRLLTGPAYVPSKGDEHAKSRDTFKASPAYLTQLHAELAGKIETNRKSGDKLRSQMVQVEAVMKMLDPDFNARAISAKPAEYRQSLVKARHSI